MKLLALILSLPTENATARQRAWRSLKASGAAVLRDGVYLMPEREDCRATLDGLASDVRDAGGAAHVLRVEEPEGANFTDLFDRGEDYAAVLGEVVQVRNVLTADTVQDTLKQVRKLRKAFASLVEIDFFPDEAQQQTDKALQELELACARALSPDEPNAMAGVIARLHSSDYQERTWATRQRPWVDRLASAWLIRRFIDPQARILWLASPGDCPADALGSDFDGATFDGPREYTLYARRADRRCHGYRLKSDPELNGGEEFVDCIGDCSDGTGYCYATEAADGELLCAPCLLWKSFPSEQEGEVSCFDFGTPQGGPLPGTKDWADEGSCNAAAWSRRSESVSQSVSLTPHSWPGA